MKNVVNKFLDAWEYVIDQILRFFSFVKKYAIKPWHFGLKLIWKSFFFGLAWFCISSAVMLLLFQFGDASSNVYLQQVPIIYVGSTVIMAWSMTLAVLILIFGYLFLAGKSFYFFVKSRSSKFRKD